MPSCRRGVHFLSGRLSGVCVGLSLAPGGMPLGREGHPSLPRVRKRRSPSLSFSCVWELGRVPVPRSAVMKCVVFLGGCRSGPGDVGLLSLLCFLAASQICTHRGVQRWPVSPPFWLFLLHSCAQRCSPHAGASRGHSLSLFLRQRRSLKAFGMWL